VTATLAQRTATLGAVEFNTVDSNGVAWVLEAINGWSGGAGSTLQLTQKANANGAWRGPAYLPSLPLELTGNVVAPNAALAIAASDTLVAAVTLAPSQLTVTEYSTQRWMMVQRQDSPDITWLTDTAFSYSLQVVAADPRKLADALVDSTGLPSSSGGLTVPFTVPFSINSTVVSGRCVLTNPGNATGPVVLRIDGPVTGPIVTHVGSGATLAFASSMTLASGEWLIVDMENQQVLANGQVSRNGWVTQRGWSGFDPGGNTWQFAATSGSGTLTVTANPAWL
jgi:hypothetical protein